MWYSNDVFHYTFKAEFVTLVSLKKIPSGLCRLPHRIGFSLLSPHVRREEREREREELYYSFFLHHPPWGERRPSFFFSVVVGEERGRIKSWLFQLAEPRALSRMPPGLSFWRALCVCVIFSLCTFPPLTSGLPDLRKLKLFLPILISSKQIVTAAHVTMQEVGY